MKAREQAKKEARPQAVEGKVFRVECKGCDFEKIRRHFGDAHWFQTHHEKKGHGVSIDQIDEPAPKEKASTAKSTHPKKKGAKKEQSKS